MTNKIIDICVDRIITLDIGDKIRVWKVTGVYLGSVRQEDMVGLKCLDKHNGINGKVDIEEMFVPLDIIRLVLKNEVEQYLAYEKETKWQLDKLPNKEITE